MKNKNAQQWFENWLNKKYPTLEERQKITTIWISNMIRVEKEEETENNGQNFNLVIKDFPRVKEIYCSDNELTSLTIINCPQLSHLGCQGNNLTNLDFLQNIDPEKLVFLDLKRNKIKGNLENLRNFVNLKNLLISNNPIIGSLKYLWNLNKLEVLDVSNTDINSGLEYLPKSIKELLCSDRSTEKKWAIKKIQTLLKGYEGFGGKHNYQAWREAKQELISQKFAPEKLLGLIYLTGLWGSNNTNHQLTQKVFGCVVFYLEEEVMKCRKELYKDKEEKAQIEIPPKH